MTTSPTTDLEGRCDLLRSLQRPGAPLLLPNAWDVPTARAVVAAGFPVVATTSGGVAAMLGHEDHEGAPGDEMLAAAARIARCVEVPVTIDAEAGYGMEPAELVSALRSAGAAGCNLEDTDHKAGSLRDPERNASGRGRFARPRRRTAISSSSTHAWTSSWVVSSPAPAPGPRGTSFPRRCERANAYLEAGADSVYPIALWEADACAISPRRSAAR